MKKFGFTLAETLITLGIIGVVAAITIPGLISEHQKRTTVTKLQRAISVLNQAYRLSYDEVGEPNIEESFAMKSEEYFNKYWAPYLKTALLCTSAAQCGYTKEAPFKYLNGTEWNLLLVFKTQRTTFYTADGFLYIILTGQGAGSGGGYVSADFVIVDINGNKGPNQFWKDVFMLRRTADDGGGIQPDSYKSSDKIVNTSCSKSSNGFSCAERIRRAGWKIDNNYPWK